MTQDMSLWSSVERGPSWLRKDFRLPVTQLDLIKLSTEINKSAPILSGLHLHNLQIGRFLGDGVLERYIDFDTLKSISRNGVNDTLGLIGSHLTQVNEYMIILIWVTYFYKLTIFIYMWQITAHTKHFTNMASSAGTSKQILSLKDSVKAVEVKLSQSSEREIQSSTKLSEAEARIAELEKKLQEEKEETSKFKALSERSTSEVNKLVKQVNHYKSTEYMNEVLEIF